MEDFVYEGAVSAPKSDENHCYNCDNFVECPNREVSLPSHVFENEYEHRG